MFRTFFAAVPIVALAIGGSTACATKKFVRTSVGEVNEKVDSQGRTIEETQERVRRTEGRVFEVVLSEDQGNFKFGKTNLPDEAKQKIDEMVAQLKQDPKNIYLEIEGHTDNVGGK